MDIHVAHSPDSDDAFMFYALATHKIDTGDRNYIHLLNDIETLNRKALEGEYEVSAISFHAYAYMADKYALLSCGASMGTQLRPDRRFRQSRCSRRRSARKLSPFRAC